jgi:hypothetical protein
MSVLKLIIFLVGGDISIDSERNLWRFYESQDQLVDL